VFTSVQQTSLACALMRDDRNRKIDFEPGKSAGTDEEGPVLQRKQTNVQRGSPLHRAPFVIALTLQLNCFCGIRN
ncbi:MAG: hypothetical protein ACK55Z_25600, partial [bacterium]